MAKISKTTNKDGSERYHKRVVVGYRPDGSPIQKMLTAGSRRELEAAARALQVDLARGQSADPGKIRLAEFIGEWRARHGKRVRATSMASYGYYIDTHILPALGGKLLKQLNVRSLQIWIDSLSTPYIAVRCKRTLHVILEDAVRQGLLGSNPASHLSTPALPPSQATSWTVEEARAFLHQASEQTYHPYWILAVRLALRPSELLGLRWSSVDLDAGTITVQEAHATVRMATFDNDSTKTPSGLRTLDLPADVLDVLKRHKVAQNKRRLALGRMWQDNDLVCAGQLGGYIANNSINRALTLLGALARVRRIRPYDLRHTAISLMAEAGADFKAISEVAGHKDVKITRNVYQHTSRKQRAKALEALGEALQEGIDDQGREAQ